MQRIGELKKLDELTKTKIGLEISKIDTLVEKSSLLLSKCKISESDFVELNAIGSILHSYYSDVESIFNLIYKSSYAKTLSGNMWHSELFSPLKEYLGFRHVFRHAYDYELDWTRLKPLFSELTENWQSVKECLTKFIETSTNTVTPP